MANWTKTTPYGDYRDPLQNHKFDRDIQFRKNNPDELMIITSQHQLLHQCRTLGTHGKHVGSKHHDKLKNAVKKVSRTLKVYNKTIQRLNKIRKEVSTTDKQ